MKGIRFIRYLSIIFACLLLFLSIMSGDAKAAIPETINYQGYLTSPAGVPVNGTVQIVFSLYDVPTGGTALWRESQNVSINDGLYSVILGTGTPVYGNLGTLPFDKQYYLGIKVGADGEMTPRQPLTSVPYSLRAETVENVGPHSHDAEDITAGPLLLSGSTATGTTAMIEGMNSGAGYGIKGWSLSNYGVYGYSSSVPGVYGYSASNAGIAGTNGSTGNYGLLGTNDYGVYGESYSANGYAGYFTGRSRVTGNLLVDGSLGIGTPTPTQKLEIKSPSSAYIVVDRGTDQLGGIAYRENGETQWIFPFVRGWQSDNLIVRDEKYNLDTMVFQAQTGNVGIGTTTPQHKLDVNGNINISTNSAYKIGGNTVLATKGSGNTFLGYDAGKATTGYDNTFLGYQTGYSDSSGYYNTFLGRSAGYSNTTGYQNTFIGNEAGYSNSSGSRNVSLGYQAGLLETGSDRLHIANNSFKTLIYGQFDNNRVCVNCTNPSTTLEVNGDIALRDNMLRLRGGTDNHHGLRWYGTNPQFAGVDHDGPVLFGWTGGALGTTDGGEKIALSWSSSGNVRIWNMLYKGGGSFKIDHPLDPQNKYLYHSFVESPDMMNIYNGNVLLDRNGEAWVELPEWFEALNKDFRYQLTAIGAPGPNLHIASKISDNRFKIAGGKAGMEVSWQVTGIRHDPFANAHRIAVEEEKPDKERGTYLHPDVYVK